MDTEDLLPDDDIAFLKRKGWNYLVYPPNTYAGADLYLVFPNFPLSEKYTPRETKLLIKLPPGYPDTPVDMWWTVPHVVYAVNNQKPQATDQIEELLGEQWQRWSRHPTESWRIGVDCLETFFQRIISELQT